MNMIDKKEGESNKNTKARSKPKYNIYYLPIEEINQIITAAKNLKERVVLKLLARTGIRRFELCQILVQHVDFKNKSVYIPHGKGDVPRSVPVDEDTLQDIQFYIGSRQHGKLIQSNNKDSDGIDESRINIMVKNSAIRAGIKNPDPTKKYVNPHIFRHSLIRHLLKEKMPMNMIQQIAGHSDARITLQMYSIPTSKDVNDEYQKVVKTLYRTTGQ